jgi:hypothetical protein
MGLRWSVRRGGYAVYRVRVRFPGRVSCGEPVVGRKSETRFLSLEARVPSCGRCNEDCYFNESLVSKIMCRENRLWLYIVRGFVQMLAQLLDFWMWGVLVGINHSCEEPVTFLTCTIWSAQDSISGTTKFRLADTSMTTVLGRPIINPLPSLATVLCYAMAFQTSSGKKD